MDYDKSKESADYILQRTSARPQLGVICGSGLAALGDILEKPFEIPYAEIPHFPVSTAPGHKSRLLFGLLDGVSVVLMQGRFHLYEGYTIHQCAVHIRVLRLLGIQGIIISNAAGGLNPDFKVGDIMLIHDHINLMSFVGINPLCGANDARFGPRFFALDQAYDYQWIEAAKKVAQNMNIGEQVKEGVYTMLGGPSFETPAELRMLRLCGVDAVGMSTIHEAITAKHCGLRVFAFSLITNLCNCQRITDSANSQVTELADEVFDVTRQMEPLLKDFLRKLVADFHASLGRD